MQKFMIIEGHEKKAAERIMEAILKNVPKQEQNEQYIQQDIEYISDLLPGACYVDEKMPENASKNMANYFCDCTIEVNGNLRTILVLQNMEQ